MHTPPSTPAGESPAPSLKCPPSLAGLERLSQRKGGPGEQLSPHPCLRWPQQVFGKGNTAFWVIFSVIHIIATLLLSTQLYYMGRWKLGERSPGARWGWWPRGPGLMGDFWVLPSHRGPRGVTGYGIR